MIVHTWDPTLWADMINNIHGMSQTFTLIIGQLVKGEGRIGQGRSIQDLPYSVGFAPQRPGFVSQHSLCHTGSRVCIHVQGLSHCVQGLHQCPGFVSQHPGFAPQHQGLSHCIDCLHLYRIKTSMQHSPMSVGSRSDA